MYYLEYWTAYEGWNEYASFGTLTEAQKEAKKINGLWRILQIIEVGS